MHTKVTFLFKYYLSIPLTNNYSFMGTILIILLGLLMAKLTLNAIGSRYGSIDALNDNSDLIEAAFENTLSRDGTGPNNMESDLDMDSNSIINVGDISVGSLRIGGVPVSPGSINFTGMVKQTIVATAGQTVFNLTTVSYAPLTNNLSVYIDGVYQNPSRYTETNPTQVTLTEGVHVGAVVDFVVLSLTALPGTVDAANVTYTPGGSGVETTTVATKLQQTVSILDFVPNNEHADILDGTSTFDISNAIRYAIDSLGPNGGVVQFPNGGAGVVGSTVYIPPKGYGVMLQGNKFAITGGGVGTHAIFETGMPGNSFGGSTNWNEPNESVPTLGLVIRDFVFLECGTAIKAFNALWRSEFSGNWAYQNVSTLLHLKRCFYSKTLSNHAIIGRVGRGANEPCYWFEEVVNVQTIVGNNASNVVNNTSPSGTGYLFTGGMAGLSFSNNSAEGCITGLKVTGEITGAEIVGCYFELNTVGIDLGSAGKTLDIGGCFFFSNVTTAISCAGGWVAGTLKANNSIDPACLVDLSGLTNALTIERPLLPLPLTLAYSGYEVVPSTFSLSGSISVRRPTSAYDAVAGQNAQRGLLSEQTNGIGLVALPYAGDLGAASGDVPVFCFSAITANTVTVDTKIVYRPNLCAQFTARMQDNILNYKIAGAVRWGDTVFRLDATAVTVVASDSAGFLRLVFGNLGTSISISDIRIWIG